jgi:hypothetical protein
MPNENAWELAEPERVLSSMGHNRGRDNVKKRAGRRKKAERLALAKKRPSHGAAARQAKKTAK